MERLRILKQWGTIGKELKPTFGFKQWMNMVPKYFNQIVNSIEENTSKTIKFTSTTEYFKDTPKQ